MSKTTCASPIPALDREIANNNLGWNPLRARFMRGIYERKLAEEGLSEAQINERVEELIRNPAKFSIELNKLAKELNKKDSERIAELMADPTSAIDQLKESFSVRERIDRINLIVNLFSDIVDQLEAENPLLTRKQILEGVVGNNGEKQFGIEEIFKIINRTLVKRRTDALTEKRKLLKGDNTKTKEEIEKLVKEYDEIAGKYKKIIANFAALTVYARGKIAAREKVKVPSKLKMIVDTTILNEDGENTEITTFVPEESVKDKWQEIEESISPVSRLSQEVRLLISRLPRYKDDGTLDIDDLGEVRTVDVAQTHQELVDILFGVSSENEMIEILGNRNNIVLYPHFGTLLKAFEKDPLLRTQFYIDMNKNLQRYSMQNKKRNNDGTFDISVPILNDVAKDEAFSRYEANILTKKAKTNKSTIFKYGETEAVTNVAAIDELLTTLKRVFPNDSELSDNFADLSAGDLQKFYREVFNALGITVSPRNLNSIIYNARNKRAINRSLVKIMSLLKQNPNSSKVISYSSLLSYKAKFAGSIKEHIGKIYAVTETTRAKTKVLKRVRYNDNTYFSDVLSSYLGRFMTRIEKIVRSNKPRKYIKSDLRSFLKSRFGGQGFEYYYDKDGNPLNFWLQFLGDEDSIGEQEFLYKKLLGDENTKIDNFFSKAQMITTIQNFFCEGLTADHPYGWYPVFVLGDSNASKWIKAPRLSEQQVIDALFDVFKQELLFSRNIEELRNSLRAEGKSLGTLGSIILGKFYLLPFLNNPEVIITIDLDNEEETVKKAIKKHLDEAYEVFKKRLETEGVLEKTSKGKYKYLGKLTNVSQRELAEAMERPEFAGKSKEEVRKILSERALEEKLKHFFINYKLATVSQIELMVGNPGFYKNGDVIDLQKRYKAVHSSGNVLSPDPAPVEGDPDSYDADHFYQKVVFFEEVKSNTEETNPEFMLVIKALYGENSNTYKQYTKASHTDGQGYRTLTSYKEIMRRAGKWNKECQAAYQRLQEIRAEIRNSESQEATIEQVREINKLMITYQPIKAFTCTMETVDCGENSIKVPVYMKYAEVPVIPELLPKNSRLRHMMEWAEDNEVGLMAATTTAKATYFGEVGVNEVSSKEELFATLDQAFQHELSLEDYLIQTNVPEHVYDSRLFATQLRKIIPANLKKFDDEGNKIYYNEYVGISDPNKEVAIGHGKTTKLDAEGVNKLYVSIIAANILEDFHKFQHLIEDPQKVRDLLVHMTINNERETEDNLKGFTLLEGNSENSTEQRFLMALFEGGIEYNTAALLWSVYKNQVNKQKILGGSAVQVSSYGITGYNEAENLQFVGDPKNPENILYAEVEIPWDLSYKDSSGHTVKLQFEDWCNPNGTLKLGSVVSEDDPDYKDFLSYKDENGVVRRPLIEEKYPGILSFVAYRIPTEEKYSLINCKVVRFSLKVNGGGTIKVPAQGVVIAGFDFDIDKLYFIRKEFKYKPLDQSTVKDVWEGIYTDYPEIKEALEKEKFTAELVAKYQTSEEAAPEVKDRLYKYWEEAGFEGTPREFFDKYLQKHRYAYLSFEEYNPSIPAFDKAQSRVGRNNMLLKIIQKRLEDPNTIRERTTPGGFPNLEKAVKSIRDLLGIDASNLDYTDPWTMIDITQQNQVADKLIGIFANQNISNAIATLMKRFELTTPIRFGNHTTRGLSNLINPNSLSKELLAAAVDAVKNPVFKDLGINTITSDSAGLLCRLGYSFEEIGLLFNQPIIRDLCKYCLDRNLSDVSSAISSVLKDWNIDVETDVAIPTTADLIRNIEEFRDNPAVKSRSDFALQQAGILMLFKDIYTDAKEVGQFVTNTKFTASNAVKSTFGGMYEQQFRVEKYIQALTNDLGNDAEPRIILEVSDELHTPITQGLSIDDDPDSYMEEVLKNPFGYEQVMYDANVGAIKVLSRYYPYETKVYKDTRRYMNTLSKYGLTEDTINDIHQHIVSYLLAQLDDSPFNPTTVIECIDDEGESRLVTCLEYYTEIFPKKLLAVVNENEELNSLPLFSLMVPKVSTYPGTNKEFIELRLLDSGALLPDKKEAVRESWEVLLATEYRDLAIGLYMYSYYKSGFGFGVVGFNHLAPLELKLNLFVDNETLYPAFLNNILDDNIQEIDLRNFAVSFLSVNPKNNKLVYKPINGTPQATLVRNKIYQGSTISSSFEINIDEEGAKAFCLSSQKGITNFSPAVFIDNNLYIADGANFNISGTGSMRYVRIPYGNNLYSAKINAKAPENPEGLGMDENPENPNPEGDRIIEIEVSDLEDVYTAISRFLVIEEDLTKEEADFYIETRAKSEIKTEAEEGEKTEIDVAIEQLIELYKTKGVRCSVTKKIIC